MAGSDCLGKAFKIYIKKISNYYLEILGISAFV